MAENPFADLIPQGRGTQAIANPFADLIPTGDPINAANEKLKQGLNAGQRGDQETYRTAAFRTNQGLPAANATDAAIQGVTLGFGDEISAATRAPIDMAIRGEGYNEAYQHNLAAERDRLEQYRKANPVTSTAAEFAGGLIVPAGTSAVRTGATLGALYGAGNSEGDLSQRAADAGVGAVAGGVLGAAANGAARVIRGKSPSSAPSIAELEASATKGYESPEVKSLAVKPTVIRNFGEAAEAALTNEGFAPTLAEKTFGMIRNLQRVPEGSVITGDNINTLRKMFGKAAQSSDKTEAAAASKVIGFLDDALTKVPTSEVISGDLPAAAARLEAARGDYAAASQAKNIDNKLISAELRASSTNSGQNVSNTIRQNLRNVVDPTKPRDGRGLLPEEIDAAERIVRGTPTENALRTTGNYLGKLQGTAIGGVLGSTFGPAGAAVGAAIPSTAGFLMKSVANRMTVKQAEKLSEMIRSRAPLASSAEKFEEAAAKVANKRDPKAVASVVLAARNLSTNLRSAGLNFSPTDLLSGLQSPSSSSAEQQQ